MIGEADRTEDDWIRAFVPIFADGIGVRTHRYRYTERWFEAQFSETTDNTVTLTMHVGGAFSGLDYAPSANVTFTKDVGTAFSGFYAPSAKGRLKQYAGEWVALDDGNVIAHDSSAIAVLQSARDQGVRKPHILFVEDIEDGVSRIGF